MRVPSSLLPTRIVITTQTATAGNGTPVLSRPRTCKARIERKRRAVKTGTGVNVISTAAAIVRPDVTVAVEDRVDIGPLTYDVLEVNRGEGLRHTAFLELVLGGPR